jgi:hypothetical protein
MCHKASFAERLALIGAEGRLATMGGVGKVGEGRTVAVFCTPEAQPASNAAPIRTDNVRPRINLRIAILFSGTFAPLF